MRKFLAIFFLLSIFSFSGHVYQGDMKRLVYDSNGNGVIDDGALPPSSMDGLSTNGGIMGPSTTINGDTSFGYFLSNVSSLHFLQGGIRSPGDGWFIDLAGLDFDGPFGLKINSDGIDYSNGVGFALNANGIDFENALGFHLDGNGLDFNNSAGFIISGSILNFNNSAGFHLDGNGIDYSIGQGFTIVGDGLDFIGAGANFEINSAGLFFGTPKVISNLQYPTLTNHAANKAYVDAATNTGNITLFIPITLNSGANIDNYRSRTITGTGNGNITFIIPGDFASLVSLEMIFTPTAGAAGTGKDIDLISSYGQVGELITAHQETDTTTTFDTGTVNTHEMYSVSNVFSSIAANDICGLNIDHNTIGGTIHYFYLKIVYDD